MIIECPHCKARYDAKPEHVGIKMVCSTCNTEFEVKNPNLIQCPDCFQTISKHAVACPFCGAPIQDSTKTCGDQNDLPTEEAEEEVIMILHPSRKKYLGAIIIGIITIPLIIGIILLLVIEVTCKIWEYRITNKRVIVKGGVLTRSQSEVWIKDIRGIHVRQDAGQQFVGIGNVLVGTAATGEVEVCLADISKPQAVADTINSLRTGTR